jgi:hypothetical protein
MIQEIIALGIFAAAVLYAIIFTALTLIPSSQKKMGSCSGSCKCPDKADPVLKEPKPAKKVKLAS